jgi:hypothetical protein
MVVLRARHGQAGDASMPEFDPEAAAFLERPREKGPHRTADRAADVTSDLAVSGFRELADSLGC